MLGGGFAQTAAAAEFAVCTSTELSNAIAGARPGDEIVLCNGSWADIRIELDVEGTASAPIVLRAETPGEVLMTGSSTLRLAGTHVVVDGLVWTGTYSGNTAEIIEFRSSGGRDCNYCRLTNSAVIDYNTADPSDYQFWIMIHGQNNRVDHNYFSGKTSVGSILQVARESTQANRARIDHNFFSRPRLHLSNGGETIQIGTSGTYASADSETIVEANFFFEANGEIEIISNKASGTTFRRNTFVGSQGMLSLRQGDRVLVEANYFFGNGFPLTGGVRINGESHTIVNNYFEGLNPGASIHRGAISFSFGDASIDTSRGYYHYAPVRNVLVAHNTIVDSVNSIYFKKSVTDSLIGPDQVRIVNNIVSNRSAPLIVEFDPPQAISYEHNIFDGEQPTVDGTGNLFGAPGLERNSNDVLQLAGSGMAVGAAIPLTAVPRDIDETNRDSLPDIGADEYQAGHHLPPTNLCDVGPLSFKPALKQQCTGGRPNPPTHVSTGD